MAADDTLEVFFAAGRAEAPIPSADLLSRIMADAQAQSAAPVIIAPRPGLFANLIESIGGWPTLAGMATAGVFGVWVGFSQPAGLDLVAEQMMGTDNSSYLVDLLPAFGTEFEEG